MINAGTKAGQYFFYGLILIFSVVFIDQYSKWAIIESVLRVDGELLPFREWFVTPRHLEYFIDEWESYNSMEIAPFLNFVMVWNQGISFGLLDNNKPEMAWLLTGISIAIALGFIIWLALTDRFLTAFSLSLISGGAIGNAIDRMRFRAVADFIEFHIAGFHFPVFNFADICITIGAVGLAWALIFEQQKSYLTVDV